MFLVSRLFTRSYVCICLRIQLMTVSNEPAVHVRTRALKALSSIIAADPNILSRVSGSVMFLLLTNNGNSVMFLLLTNNGNNCNFYLQCLNFLWYYFNKFSTCNCCLTQLSSGNIKNIG